MATRRPNPVAAAAARRANANARRTASNARAQTFAQKLSRGRVGPGSGTNIRTGGGG